MNIIPVTNDRLTEAGYLFNEYRKFYGQTSNLEGAEAFLTERYEQKQSILWLAEIDGQAAGFVQLYPSFSSIAMQRVYILNDLFVLKAFRRHGVAKALMETCYTYCKAKQARYIRLETDHDNHSAQRLYEQMGMHVEEHVKHYVKYWENNDGSAS